MTYQIRVTITKPKTANIFRSPDRTLFSNNESGKRASKNVLDITQCHTPPPHYCTNYQCFHLQVKHKTVKISHNYCFKSFAQFTKYWSFHKMPRHGKSNLSRTKLVIILNTSLFSSSQTPISITSTWQLRWAWIILHLSVLILLAAVRGTSPLLCLNHLTY